MKIERSSDFPSRDFSIEEFIQYVKPFDLISSLMSLQRLAGLMGNQVAVNTYIGFEFHSSPKVTVKAEMFTRDFVSFLAKQILLNCEESLYPYSDADLLHMIHLYNNLRIDLNEYAEQEKHMEQGWLWVIRASNQQWFYKRLYSAVMARYLWLFTKVFELDPALGEKLNSALGIDLFDVMKIGTCIYANYCPREDGVFADSFLMSSYTETSMLPLRTLLSESNILSFFDIFATDQESFKTENLKYELPNPLLKKYEFNPLKRFPVIRTESAEKNMQFIIPSMPDFLYGTFEGLYYVLIDRMSEEDKSNLRTVMGQAFEPYLAELTNYYEIPALSSLAMHPETPYRVGRDEWKSADHLLVGEEIIFQLECKVRKIDNYSRAGVQSEDGPGIEKLLTDIAKELDKLVKKEQHIKDGLVDGVVFGGQEIVNIIVCFDEMFGMNQYARKAIKEKMTTTSDNFRIFGIWEYEIICQHAKNSGKSLMDSIKDFEQGNTEIFNIDFLDEIHEKFFKAIHEE